MAEEERSELARAIEAEGRHVRCVPLDGFTGPGGQAIPAVAFRVAVKADEDAAIVAAHKYATENAGKAGDVAAAAARSDIDLLADAKNVEALYRVCFQAEEDGAGGWRMITRPKPGGVAGVITPSAFPSPSWMRAWLTTDQIAHLMNAYLEVRAEASPAGPIDLSEETVAAVATLCAEHAATDLPELALAKYPRHHLTHLFVRLAQQWVERGRAVEALLPPSGGDAPAASADDAP